MKKFFAIIAVAIATVFTANVANAQTETLAGQDTKTVSYRVYTGLNVTSTINNETDLTFKRGLALGADGLYMINNYFGVSAGLEFANGGWTFDNGSFSGSTTTINMLGAPVMANIYLFKGFDVMIGLKPNYVFNSNITNGFYRDSEAVGGNNAVNNYNTDLVLGVSYQYKKVVFELRSNGTSDPLFKNDTHTGKKAVRMGNAFLSIGYRF